MKDVRAAASTRLRAGARAIDEHDVDANTDGMGLRLRLMRDIRRGLCSGTVQIALCACGVSAGVAAASRQTGGKALD